LSALLRIFVCNILPNPSIQIGPAGVGLIRISGGLLVPFVGPWQFWTGLRRTVPRIHRWTGRLFFSASPLA
jgi:hypothetical protein